MEWEGRELPKISGKYIVSVGIKNQGVHIVNAPAFFDANTNEWYKVDPYDITSPHTGQVITDKINGWVKGLPSYLGAVGDADRKGLNGR